MLQTRERMVLALREVEAALARIDAGTFGVCEDCGAEIRKPRLSFNPSVRTCLRCQVERECLEVDRSAVHRADDEEC